MNPRQLLAELIRIVTTECEQFEVRNTPVTNDELASIGEHIEAALAGAAGKSADGGTAVGAPKAPSDR